MRIIRVALDTHYFTEGTQMNKAISLLLVLVLCLCLCACGVSHDESTIELNDETSVFIGKWDARTDRLVLIVNEDQTA